MLYARARSLADIDDDIDDVSATEELHKTQLLSMMQQQQQGIMLCTSSSTNYSRMDIHVWTFYDATLTKRRCWPMSAAKDRLETESE